MPDEPVTPAPEPTPTPKKERMELFDKSVENLIEKIEGHSTKVAQATDNIPVNPPTDPAPAPSANALSPERIDEIVKEKGVGAAIQEVGRQVLVPMQYNQYTVAAKQQKRNAEKDPTVGPLFKKYRKEVDEYIKTNGINDIYLAEHGYEELVERVAGNDPEYRKSKNADEVNAEVTRRLAEERKAAGLPEPGAPDVTPSTPEPSGAPSVVRPPIDRPHAGAVSAPTLPGKTAEQEIAAVQMSDTELDFQRRHFHMSPKQAKVQRLEIQRLDKKYGEYGIRSLGGYPVCTLAECGVPVGDTGEE